MGKMNASIAEFWKDIRMREKLGLDLISESYYCLGNAYHRKSWYSKAIECHEYSIYLYEQEAKADDTLEIANSSLALGITYSALRQKEKALECMKRALKIQEEKAPDSHEMSRTCHAIGSTLTRSS